MLVAFTLLLGGGGAASYFAIRDSLYDQFDASLRVKALIVITDTQVAGGRIRVYFTDRFLREFDDALATEFFQVFDEAGRPVENSDSLPQGGMLPFRAGTLEEPDYWNLELPNGEPGRAVGIRFQPTAQRRRGENRPEAPDVEAVVVVAASRRAMDQTLAQLRHVLTASGLGALLLTILIVPWALRRGLRPLDQLAVDAARIDAASLAQRFDIAPLPRELQSIGGRLNDLLSRLEASFERERRFSADIAHELRTPLAELRTQAEVALKWPDERSPATDQAVLEIALQMERLVSRLLALGRAEQARVPVEQNRVLLRPLLDTIVAAVAPLAAARAIRLVLDVPDAAEVTTDAVMLRSILTNLLENAVHYAPRGSTVQVRCEAASAHVRCFVSNEAPDLAAEDLPRMFERFWRKDPARSSGGAHSGLGLALSRSFARLMGGEVTAALDADRRITLRLELPRSNGA